MRAFILRVIYKTVYEYTNVCVTSNNATALDACS
jgi:hypothetical protein